MAPYLIMALFPLICYGINSSRERSGYSERKLFYVVCMASVIIFFTCCRSVYLGSTDSVKYFAFIKDAYYFDSLSSFLAYSKAEKGFVAWIWLLTRIFEDPQVIFAINAMIALIPVFWFIYKYAENVYFSVFLFITFGTYQFLLQGMRQSMAMAICLIALDFARKRKIIPFVIAVGLAVLLHKSAIVFIPVYFIFSKWKHSKRTMFLVVLLSVLAIFLFSNFLDIANSYFDNKGYGDIIPGGVPTAIIWSMVVIGSILVFGKNKDNKAIIPFFYMTIIGVSFFFMRYTVAHVAERLAYYYIPASFVTIPVIVRQIDYRNKELVRMIVIVVIFALYIYQISHSNLFPYSFFWSNN